MAENGKTNNPKAIAEYVINNIDTAIRNGYIKAYYQPVIRSLTGQLCGAESLARWIDPEYGFLAPYLFIGPLEDSKQIYKLDCYIIEKVCQEISERLSKNLPTVPVSINFSRLDFEAKDMLFELESAVEKNNIPRDFIHIEITESMIASDEELMRTEIERFRSAGYEVWMDDFGSGYSSLTVLKDYDFDTIKLDMHFLSSFTEKSKSIVTNTVTMAKNIGTKTLAEGVETQEQVEFLKRIGCARLQGYYYGKPMPLDEFFDVMDQKQISVEERKWRHYYDVASFSAIETDEPLELLEYENRTFKTLFVNDIFKRQVMNKDCDTEYFDRIIYHAASPLLEKYVSFAETLIKTGNMETFYYTYNGNILRFKGRKIAENNGRYLIRGSIINISLDRETTKLNDLTYRLKELNHLFEVVLLANIENDSISPLLGRYKYVTDDSVNETSLKNHLEITRNNIVHPADRERFKLFFDITSLRNRIEAFGNGYVETIFRMKQDDGNYKWKEVSILLIPGTTGKEYLICVKSIIDDAKKHMEEASENFIQNIYDKYSEKVILAAYMWQNMITSSNIKFFWKDKERRFLGVSQSFLDFYGIESLDEIIGKTDEDIRWNVDENSYMSDEIDVIKKGKVIKNAPGQCIVNGIVHNIVANKTPFYIDNEIGGLLGYFIDCDEENSDLHSATNRRSIDPVTGLMNAKAFTDAMIDYAIEYRENKKDYGLIVIRNSNYERIRDDFGDSFCKKLLSKTGKEIIKVTGQSCAVARTKDSEFALLTYLFKPDELEHVCRQVKAKVEAIKEVNGIEITIKLQTSCIVRSETELSDEALYQYALNNLS